MATNKSQDAVKQVGLSIKSAWQLFQIIISGVLDELKVQLGNTVLLAIESIDIHVYGSLCRHYGLNLRYCNLMLYNQKELWFIWAIMCSELSV